MTKNYKSGSYKKYLAGVLAAGMLASGCATPNCIKERRYLALEGKLDNSTYTQVSANDRDTMVRAGITVNFNNAKDLVDGAASAFTALGYGFIRPLYGEFWRPSKPEKFEYSGLTPLLPSGYQAGRKSETLGEWLRYAAIVFGVCNKNGGDKSAPVRTTPAQTTYTAPQTQSTPAAQQQSGSVAPVVPVVPADVTPAIEFGSGGFDGR